MDLRSIWSAVIACGLLVFVCACEPEKKSPPEEKAKAEAKPAPKCCETAPCCTAPKPTEKTAAPAPAKPEAKAPSAEPAKPEAKTPEPALAPTWDLDGKLAPEIRAATWLNTDKPLTLQEFRKKKFVLLAFWFPKCPHCQKETPRIQGFYGRFNGPNLQVITLVSDLKDNREGVEKYMKEQGLTFPVGIDDGNKTHEQYAMHSVPFVYIINRFGYVVWQGHPHYLEERYLEELTRLPAAE